MDVTKLKVADLKKELKARNMSTSGNKQELIDRLVSAWQEMSGDSLVLNLEDGDIDDGLQGEEEDDDVLSDSTLMLEPSQTVLQCSPSKTSSGQPVSIENDTLLSLEIKSKAKKIVLNRTNLPALESENLIGKKDDGIEHKRINIASVNLSAGERLALRAQKFGLQTPSNYKAAESQVKTSGVTKLTVSGTTPALDVLKKRAERFGTSVSNVMKTVEAEERKCRRRERFNIKVYPVGIVPRVPETSTFVSAGNTSDTDNSEKPKRIRITGPGSTTTILDKKQLRAQRFKMT